VAIVPTEPRAVVAHANEAAAPRNASRLRVSARNAGWRTVEPLRVMNFEAGVASPSARSDSEGDSAGGAGLLTLGPQRVANLLSALGARPAGGQMAEAGRVVSAGSHDCPILGKGPGGRRNGFAGTKMPETMEPMDRSIAGGSVMIFPVVPLYTGTVSGSFAAT
jgi:hypothetical protein